MLNQSIIGFDPDHLIAGVDTHADTHTLAVLSGTGGVLFTETFSADAAGYRYLIEALEAAGEVTAIGVDGTNSYGAGLARALSADGFHRPRGAPPEPAGAPHAR